MAGTLWPANRRDHEQTTTTEPRTGLQGESGACRHQRRSDVVFQRQLANLRV